MITVSTNNGEYEYSFNFPYEMSQELFDKLVRKIAEYAQIARNEHQIESIHRQKLVEGVVTEHKASNVTTVKTTKYGVGGRKSE